jgi:predicted transcriptional regulator
MAQRNRTSTDILAQILNAANYSGSINKSKIMYKANISYTQLKEYTSIMVESDLLKYDENKQTYRVTDRGLRFLKVYEHINELIHC